MFTEVLFYLENNIFTLFECLKTDVYAQKIGIVLLKYKNKDIIIKYLKDGNKEKKSFLFYVQLHLLGYYNFELRTK
jgi:hypothetical protein